MAEPTRNTYVLTVILHDVKKDTAVLVAGDVLDLATGYYGDVVGEVQVMTSHLKDFLDEDS